MDQSKDSEENKGELKKGEEANKVKIVVQNFVKKFGENARLLKESKEILKSSKHIDETTLSVIKSAY